MTVNLNFLLNLLILKWKKESCINVLMTRAKKRVTKSRNSRGNYWRLCENRKGVDYSWPNWVLTTTKIYSVRIKFKTKKSGFYDERWSVNEGSSLDREVNALSNNGSQDVWCDFKINGSKPKLTPPLSKPPSSTHCSESPIFRQFGSASDDQSQKSESISQSNFFKIWIVVSYNLINPDWFQ